MKVYKNKSGLEFEVVERLSKEKVLVRFIETGSLVVAWSGNVAAGKISDPYHKSRLNIGYLGHFDKKPYYKQAYQLWSNMLKRCYDKNDPKGYYTKGVVVDPHWHCFSNFLNDLPKLEGFNFWVTNQKYQLDKDTIGDGKTYSKETCAFIPETLNKSLGKKGKKLIDVEWVTTIL